MHLICNQLKNHDAQQDQLQLQQKEHDAAKAALELEREQLVGVRDGLMLPFPVWA